MKGSSVPKGGSLLVIRRTFWLNLGRSVELIRHQYTFSVIMASVYILPHVRHQYTFRSSWRPCGSHGAARAAIHMGNKLDLFNCIQLMSDSLINV